MKIRPNTLPKINQTYLNVGNNLYYTIKEIDIGDNIVCFYYGKHNNVNTNRPYSKFIHDIKIKHFILHK